MSQRETFVPIGKNGAARSSQGSGAPPGSRLLSKCLLQESPLRIASESLLWGYTQIQGSPLLTHLGGNLADAWPTLLKAVRQGNRNTDWSSKSCVLKVVSSMFHGPKKPFIL